MRMHWPLMSVVMVLVVPLGLLAGCGGRAVNFPVADNTPVSDVTVPQAQEMCRQSVGAVADQVVHAQCDIIGLRAAGKGGNCEQATNDCLANPPSELDFGKACDEVNADALDKLKACDITVGEYENCVNDMIDAVRASVSSLSCSMTVEDLTKIHTPTAPSSCTSLASRCPSLDINVPGSGDGSGSTGG